MKKDKDEMESNQQEEEEEEEEVEANEEEKEIDLGEEEEEMGDEDEEEEDEIIDLDAEEIIDLDEIGGTEEPENANKDAVKETNANQTTTNRNDMHLTQFEEGKHPFAVRLNNLDLNSVSKEEVINILLRSKEFNGGSPDNLIKSKLRLRNKKNKTEKYKHIQTTINNNQNKPNYLLNNSAANVYDFDTAFAKVVRELGNGGGDSNEKKL